MCACMWVICAWKSCEGRKTRIDRVCPGKKKWFIRKRKSVGGETPACYSTPDLLKLGGYVAEIINIASTKYEVEYKSK